MMKNFRWIHRTATALATLGLILALVSSAAAAQENKAPKPTADKNNPTAQEKSRITPDESKKLFALVDELIQFSSKETGLTIKAPVKRKLITRDEVAKYLKTKFAEDKSAKRLERDEILLKKFGLLDRDFELRPFLLSLLTEQIEAYYDEKTRTVNLLDWVAIDEQKSVMAHELTHALQDQRVGLEKWGDQTPNDVSHDASADIDHIRHDEWDTARSAVTEGQATAVMTDYLLKPMGKSLIKDPEVSEILRQQMGTGSSDSPVMARAPLLLSESMLFPYRDGLSFVQDLWMDKGQAAAFAGVLDHPPTSSWEILNPREFEQRHWPSVPLLPNLHPLVDGLYTPYDIGQIGQLDTHILTQLLGGEQASGNLTPAWNGGLYWVGQLKNAKTAAERSSTASLAMLYLSVWKNRASADAFARLYAENLGRKYAQVKTEGKESTGTETTQFFSTAEGPVVLTRRGAMVFVAESFPKDLALKLTELVLDAQGTGELRMASAHAPLTNEDPRPALSADLVHLFAQSGALKAVVQAGMKTAEAQR